ncbi:Carboxy-terminal-processing protease [Candidatus Promineifilum breve]|uniref:Carboxy-terminal-processing protease n=1 Tax=Candidatus Promineifilum breve TaxID=1806508 RepID=A0A170PE40_9CHLR|nr:S41 family peptidase [Candidatus Promineifilum breve]CUS02357.2 Carboxy-terminal-processing protease [Candidatus Promineifilum breve]
MASNYHDSSPPPSRSTRPGWLLLALALLFGAGMGLAGFLAGRATAEPAAAVAALPTTVPTAAPANDAEPLSGQSATATAAPTATPLPTQPPTALPSATSEPTAEPFPPTAEPDGLGIIAPPPGSPLSSVDFATLYEVWDIIAEQYDGDLPPAEELIQALVSGSLETLNDDYTRYVPADVAQRMREDQDGAVEGIGAFVLENDEGLFEIVRPIDGQPADLAGVKAGDVLIEIDGQSVIDLSFDEVILLVRGPQGTSVNLKFLREGEEEPLEFTIVRTRFEVPVVTAEVLPTEMTGGAAIGYIHLTEFTTNAEEKLYEAIDQLLAQGVTGLVLDLRDNPGGFLDQSVAVADAFLPEGVVLYERNMRGLDETFTSIDGDAAESIPLVVLVNAGSASASEIVAGALQDRGRAVLVGETTFGKGSVQQIHPLSDGSELRVTIARWYTPNDNTIDSVGITPDIEVESPEDLGGPEDGQLMRAIEWLLTGQ